MGRKINQSLRSRARGWWGWMIIVLLFTSYSLCHDVIIMRHNPGLAQLVVVFSFPRKTTAFWLITHQRYTGAAPDGLCKETGPDGPAFLLLLSISCITARAVALHCRCLHKNLFVSIKIPKVTSHKSHFIGLDIYVCSWPCILQPAGRLCPTFLPSRCVAQLGDHECVSNYWAFSTHPWV